VCFALTYTLSLQEQNRAEIDCYILDTSATGLHPYATAILIVLIENGGPSVAVAMGPGES
jgi:hypothetical protein